MSWRAALYAAWLGMAITGFGASASARAFDLQCDDTRYRIDLKRKAWCQDDCTNIWGLSHRRGHELVLSRLSHFLLTYDMQAKVVTLSVGGSGAEPETYRDRCRVLRFSGFPPGGLPSGR